MATQKVEETDRYQAVDENGEHHTVVVYTTFTEFAPINGPAKWLAGAKTHETENGDHVNVHPKDGTLTVLQTGRIMRRV